MGFFEMWNPVVLLFVVVVGLVYRSLTSPSKAAAAGEEPVSSKVKLSFYTGIALFYIGQGSPINYLGHHYLFSVHMLQQSLLYLIMPIFILNGLPAWLIRPLFKGTVMNRLLRFFTHPLISVLAFNLLFSIYHLPLIMDTLMENEWMLLGYHGILLFTAFAMWFPVFTPLPEHEKLSSLMKLAYIAVNGILLTPACALIIFASEPIYAMYANVVIPFNALPLLDDQQLGGVLMKVIQEIVYGSALAMIFFKWYRTERAQEDELSDDPQGNNGLTTA
ncbi:MULTISPECIES: cytochrome c oxidase assembly protein [Paenibacillus]|uniref:cytochrome c oxidase assembly protein n=1 Tax=Paenibacillus TaxID=44249 RepID=UPI00020D7505|nr:MULTISPECIES: cytochrome c oxidase assembly protein [Paenibacillus]EGL19875.1 putative cytochrome c oxidase assembly factor CtaG [Paenibacillus sp. HGF7]EPD88630.1 cytochrome c oxidase assembly factor CtaG [Paenibacillus sp. HGH0039]MBV6716673.1 cytochrome c oxidase assembly protein [Paenibacillus chitinolyticus]